LLVAILANLGGELLELERLLQVLLADQRKRRLELGEALCRRLDLAGVLLELAQERLVEFRLDLLPAGADDLARVLVELLDLAVLRAGDERRQRLVGLVEHCRDGGAQPVADEVAALIQQAVERNGLLRLFRQATSP